MSLPTLAGPAQFMLEVKKSRHLAQASPVEDPEQALAFVAAHSDASASHNCWAYRIGAAYRSSDDGEPSGTAGRPILAAIDGQGLDGVVVLVTRWFGGIKLGAGGLARAYGGAAAECLRLAPRLARVAQVELEVACGFAHAATLHALALAHLAQKQDEAFDSKGVLLRLALPADRSEAFALALADATRGQAQVRRVQ